MINFFKKIQPYSIISLSCFPILPYIAQSVLLMVVAFLGLILLYHNKENRQNLNKTFLILNAWVFIIALTLFWSSNLNVGISHIQKTLTFTGVTFTFALFKRELNSDLVSKMKTVFIFAVWGGLILHEFHFMHTLNITNPLDYLKTPFNIITQIGVYDSPFILDFHKAYYSLFILISTIFIFEKIAVSNKLVFTVYVLCLAHFTIEIIHMMSVVNVVLMLLILFIYPVYIVFKIKRTNMPLNKVVGLILLIVSFSGFGIYSIKNDENFNRKIDKTIAFINGNDSVRSQNKISRTQIWKLSSAIISNHPLGVGVGDVQEVLDDSYINNNLEKLKRKKINSHNQYINFLLIGGPFLLIVFLFSFAYLLPMKISNIALCFLVIVWFANLMLENMLIRVNGLWAFGFSFSLMIFSNKTISDGV